MEKFKKYPSILHWDNEKEMQKIRDANLDKGVFVVQEKVHGANFSMWTDGKEVKPAKRTAFLEEDDKFFNFQKVVNKYENQVFALFQDLKKIMRDLEYIIVYGELFGGIYLHPKVKPVSGAISVQGGLFYCPDNDFYAFDISINGRTFLDVSQTNELFNKHKFFYAKTLFKGSLNKVLEYDIVFNSTIPALLDLPVLEKNICEGVVIKPEKSTFIEKNLRLIIKRKNKEWAEEVQKSRKDIVNDFSKKLTEQLQEEVVRFITKNRLLNVLSKMGEEYEPWQLKVAFIEDVFKDFTKKYEDEYNSLSNNKKKKVKKFVNDKTVYLIANFKK